MLANYVTMKKNTLTNIVASLLVGCGTVYSEPIHATLEVMTNQAGWFVMHIRNISTNSIRFLDIQEGTGWCGDFYEVTVQKDSKNYTSQGNCYYALAADPALVEIVPGQTYDRKIQPGAYLYEAEKAAASQIVVTYRLSAKIKDIWRSKPTRANLDLTFQTDK